MNEAWYQLKFLESTQNLKSILSNNAGQSISDRLCNNIMVCLQQGKSFFEIAESSPLETKPLIVFYGMMGFARAMIMARTLSCIETLPQKHGLKDISSNVTKLESLTLKVTTDGTLHRMNDSVRTLEKFIVHRDSDVYYVRQPTIESQGLHGRTFTLRDILARIDQIRKLYRDTFSENAKVVSCSHFTETILDSHQCLEFKVYVDVAPKEDLLQIVGDLRNTFTFLKNWNFKGAQHVAGLFVSVEFTNQKYPGQDPDHNSDVVAWIANPYTSKAHQRSDGPPVFEDGILSRTAPISGGLSSDMNTHVIEPFEGVFLSELTLFYMGMFLLSSLVRYRPDIWSNTLSRRAVSNNPVDDKALALIERFIEISLSNFPQFVVNIIKERFS
jgi:hypothetical protein